MIDNKPKTPYPGLDGWVTMLESKLDLVLSDYFTSNYDQSTIFHGQVSSFIHTLSKFWQHPVACAEAVQTELNALLGCYFKRVEVTVEPKDIDEPDSGKFGLEMKIGITDFDNFRSNQTRIVFTEESKLSRILTYNNKGELLDEQSY